MKENTRTLKEHTGEIKAHEKALTETQSTIVIEQWRGMEES